LKKKKIEKNVILVESKLIQTDRYKPNQINWTELDETGPNQRMVKLNKIKPKWIKQDQTKGWSNYTRSNQHGSNGPKPNLIKTILVQSKLIQTKWYKPNQINLPIVPG